MTPFLLQVARHYAPVLSGREPGPNYFFLFPNRRSMLFFRKYLGEEQRLDPAAAPFILPPMEPVDAFFRRASGVRKADRVSLILALYDSYKASLPEGQEADSLDEFVYWGEVMLADFNDVDSYLVAPESLFTNLAEWKSLGTQPGGLSDTQRAAMEKLVGHFFDDGEALDFGRKKVKRDFLQLWDLLLPVYRRFNAALDAAGEASDGRACRLFAERVRKEGVTAVDAAFPGDWTFVFVGFNALNGCEQTVLDTLFKAGRAECCWDCSSPMLSDPLNRASRFVAENVARYPQAFPIDPDGLGMPAFHVISVPSSVGQASVAATILGESVPPGSDPIECAVVLPDERMMMPLLNSLPAAWEEVNVTMGYPMSDSVFYGLMSTLADMQLYLRNNREGEPCFYHRHVESVFANDVFRIACGPEEEAVVERVKEAMPYYVPVSALSGTPLLRAVFAAVVTDPAVEDAAQVRRLCTWLRDVAGTLAVAVKDGGILLSELDFARQYYQGVNLLAGKTLPVRPRTFIRLLDRLLGSAAVPFQGEPLRGLQVMGPLETRCLDFRQVLILSANESVFPGHHPLPSFIPPELRVGFGLPTADSQDSIQAYNFYRLVQRAESVWLIYDARTEGLKSGEESRFVKQLEYLYKDRFGLSFKRSFAAAGTDIGGIPEIVKTPEDIEKIKARPLSASALKDYLACPARFYYSFVCGLQTDDEVQENLDGGVIGTIYHEMMQELYDGREAVFLADILTMMDGKEALRRRIEEKIMEKLRQFEVSGEDLVTAEIILEYVLQTLRRDADYLQENHADAFVIRGLECKLKTEIDGFPFKGTIDRLDTVGGKLRIVDYKTGKVQGDEKRLDDAKKAASVIENLFKNGPVQDRPDIALQLYLYDRLARDNGLGGEMPLYNAIYHVTSLFTDPVRDMEVQDTFTGPMAERLSRLLAEIGSAETGFARTDDRENVCKYCDFKNICGR